MAQNKVLSKEDGKQNEKDDLIFIVAQKYLIP